LYKEDYFELMNEGENGLQIFLIISTRGSDIGVSGDTSEPRKKRGEGLFSIPKLFHLLKPL
jgi:hypothetical protein